MASKRPSRAKSQPAKTVQKRSTLATRFPGLTTERIIIGGTVVITILILVVIFISTSNTGFNRNLDIDGVETFTVASADHRTEPVFYPQTPPVGGPHNPVWQQCGVYDSPLINEHAVHSLEHGSVWITYQPDLPQDQINRLADITRGGTHRLLSPYPGMDSPIVLSAWGVQLRVDNANDERLMQFILKYEQGAQTPEMGATCAGGYTLTQMQAGLPGG